eukprot:COSAG05_NODE_2641_length_2811_cov_2.720133_6_plen_98_part_00
MRPWASVLLVLAAVFAVAAAQQTRDISMVRPGSPDAPGSCAASELCVLCVLLYPGSGDVHDPVHLGRGLVGSCAAHGDMHRRVLHPGHSDAQKLPDG